jgi:hypothetical protein
MARWPEPPKDKPRKFEHIYKDDDGCESIWKYDLDKFPNGPISVENKYPAGYVKDLKQKQKLAKAERSLSILEKAKQAKKNDKSDRKYW